VGFCEVGLWGVKALETVWRGVFAKRRGMGCWIVARKAVRVVICSDEKVVGWQWVVMREREMGFEVCAGEQDLRTLPECPFPSPAL